MIRSILVDDEQIGRDLLADLLGAYCPNVSVVAQADSIASARAAIHRHEPNLVFLDIEMPMGNGFELLEDMRELPFEVVFTTAFEQYAVRAIRASALDYLLKPINRDELVAAVAKAERKLTTSANTRPNLEALLESLRHPNSEPSKLALPTEDGLLMVPVDDIIRCEAEGSYTWFHLTGGEKRMVSRPLKEFEEMLAETNFMRVHHSHLVNIAHVRRYVRGEGGEVVMSDNSSVLVARRKKEELLRTLGAAGLRRRR
ncbi:MAG TPA: LytTR family DNA-binding domain-containing protein [Candidatus Kapabacteria bacterium]|nr:LytTR family DNA-binding domain-containing protein [Candidatus Kapabacteria bacterium]